MESPMEIEAPPLLPAQPPVTVPDSGPQKGIDAAKTQDTPTAVVVSSRPEAIPPVSTSNNQGESVQPVVTGGASATASYPPQPSISTAVTSNPGTAIAQLYTEPAAAATSTLHQAGVGGFPALAPAPMIKQSVLDAWAQQPTAIPVPPPVPRSSFEKRGWLPPPTGLQGSSAPAGITAPNQPFRFPKVPAIVNPSQDAAAPSKRGRPRKEKLSTPPVVETPSLGGINLGWPATEQPSPPVPAPAPAPLPQLGLSNEKTIRGVQPGLQTQATPPLQQVPSIQAASMNAPPQKPAAHATPQQQSMLPNVLFAEWYIQRLGWLANALMNRPRPKEEVRDIPCGIFLTALENDGILRVQNDLNLKSFSHVVGAVGSGTLLDDILRSHTAIVVDMLQRQETERKEALELLTRSQDKIAHLELELRTISYRLSSEQDVTKRLMNALRTIQAAGLTPAQQSALGGLSNLFENPATLKRAREVKMPGLAGMTGVVEIVDLDPDLAPAKRGLGRPRRDEIIPRRNFGRSAATPAKAPDAGGPTTSAVPNPKPNPNPSVTSTTNPHPDPPTAAPPVNVPTSAPLANEPLPTSEPAGMLPAVIAPPAVTPAVTAPPAVTPAVTVPLAVTPAVSAPLAASPPIAPSAVLPATNAGAPVPPISAPPPTVQPTPTPLSNTPTQPIQAQAPAPLVPARAPGLPLIAPGLPNLPAKAPGLLNLAATPPLFKPVAPSITSAALANIAPAPSCMGPSQTGGMGPIHPGGVGPIQTSSTGPMLTSSTGPMYIGNLGPSHTGGAPPSFDLPERTSVQLSNGRGPKMTSFFPMPEKLTVEEAARRAALPPFFTVPEKTSVEEANRSVQPAPLSEEALEALRAGFVLPERVSLSVLERGRSEGGSGGDDVDTREASDAKTAAVATWSTGATESGLGGANDATSKEPAGGEAAERDGNGDVEMAEAMGSPDDVIIQGVDMGGMTAGGEEAEKETEDVPVVESEAPVAELPEGLAGSSEQELGAVLTGRGEPGKVGPGGKGTSLPVGKGEERKDAADKASALDVSKDQDEAEKREAPSLDGVLPGASGGGVGTGTSAEGQKEGETSPVRSPGHKSEAPQTPLRRSGRHK